MFKYLIDKIKNNSTIKDVIRLSWPIMSLNLFHAAYELVDSFWAGKIGADAISAISVTFPIIFFTGAIISGITVATSIVISQYKGKQDEDKIKFISSQMLIFVLIVSIVVALLGFFLCGPLLKLAGVSGYILDNGIIYTRISMIGIPFVYIFYVFQSIEKGLGNMKKSMILMTVSSLLNAFLDPIFIFNLKLGIAGDALVTIIAQFLSAAFSIYFLYKDLYKDRKQNVVTFKDLNIDKPLLKKIIDLGMPDFLVQASGAVGLYIITIITVLVTKLNSNIIASISIGLRIFLFALIPANSISNAVAVMVGQACGANNIKDAKRATKFGSLISFVFLSFIGIILFIFAYYVSAFFVNNNQVVIQEAGRFIRAISLVFGMLGIQLSIFGAFTGSGNTKISTIMLGVTVLLMVTLGYILSTTKMSYSGLYIAFPLASFMSLVVTYIIYKNGSWEKKKLIQEIENKHDNIV